MLSNPLCVLSLTSVCIPWINALLPVMGSVGHELSFACGSSGCFSRVTGLARFLAAGRMFDGLKRTGTIPWGGKHCQWFRVFKDVVLFSGFYFN